MVVLGAYDLPALQGIYEANLRILRKLADYYHYLFLIFVFGSLRGGPRRRIRRDGGTSWPWFPWPSPFNGFGGYGGHGDSGALGGGPFGGGFGAFGGGLPGGFGSFGDAGSGTGFGSFGGGGASGHW